MLLYVLPVLVEGMKVSIILRVLSKNHARELIGRTRNFWWSMHPSYSLEELGCTPCKTLPMPVRVATTTSAPQLNTQCRSC